MATNFELTLDTTAPAGPSISIDGGATYTGDVDVVCSLDTSDGDDTGYQVKIYGDVDDSFATSEYRALEANAPWVSMAATKNVRLSSGDGSKTVKIKIRDTVWNVSSEATDSITLDTSIPVPTISAGPDLTRISKVTGKDVSAFSWQVDVGFEEYKIKVVPATNSLHSAGVQIPTTAGSTNMSGAAGSYPATTNINSTIDGADLETADAGDGAKIVKVFVKDIAGLWSV